MSSSSSSKEEPGLTYQPRYSTGWLAVHGVRHTESHVLYWLIPRVHNNIYHTLAKEGPWAVQITLGQDWGMSQYLRYQCRILTQKSAQVSYPRYLHNSNSSSGYY